MNDSNLVAVTGAFGYSGRYITKLLISSGKKIITLTGHTERENIFGDAAKVYPFNFDNSAKLTESLEGASTLFNTYWVRFSKGQTTHEKAVANTKVLIKAAKDAGVKKIVHISITNPSEDSKLSYYKGKAILEKEIINSGLSYAILRPNVIFGDEGILINNIAWLLRKFPAFAVPGKGKYKIQPIYIEDLAELAVNAAENPDNQIFDAVGPEIFSYIELVKLIREKIGSKSWIIHLPNCIVYFMSKFIGLFVKDVVLTKDELKGLTGNLLVSSSPPTGKKLLSEWIINHADKLGKSYQSELKRHYS